MRAEPARRGICVRTGIVFTEKILDGCDGTDEKNPQRHGEKVLKPCYYKKEMFGRFIDDEKMYDWDSAYISQVLHSPVYAGHIIYEAKPTVSMKSKKRRYIPFEERAIVPNTHEAIIPQDRWENVQRILYSRSSSFMCDKTDYDNIFKGIVRCADCGRTMLVKVEHRRKRNSVLDQTFYCCSTYRKYGAKACDSHNLEARVLHEAVFADIQAHAKAAVSNRVPQVFQTQAVSALLQL